MTPEAADSAGHDQLLPAVQHVLRRSYGLAPTDVARIPGGTATDNFQVLDQHRERWFAKVYRGPASLERERSAIALAGNARAGGIPVPLLRDTSDGRPIEDSGPLRMSLWQYIDADTAEGGLHGALWPAVGSAVGRLHRHLRDHPGVGPRVRPAAVIVDLERSAARYDELVAAYRQRRTRDAFERWARATAEARRALLGRVAGVLSSVPALTEQVGHGDLAAPNLLVRDGRVAALIDFQPPAARSIAWEIARIGCDPRSVLRDDDWVTGFADLLAAYRDENPAVRLEDLTSAASVGCAYTLASTYPLAEPLRNPSAVDDTLRAYARARHQSALMIIDRLPEIDQLVRDRLTA